jgi:hypothetical protein
MLPTSLRGSVPGRYSKTASSSNDTTNEGGVVVTRLDGHLSKNFRALASNEEKGRGTGLGAEILRHSTLVQVLGKNLRAVAGRGRHV